MRCRPLLFLIVRCLFGGFRSRRATGARALARRFGSALFATCAVIVRTRDGGRQDGEVEADRLVILNRLVARATLTQAATGPFRIAAHGAIAGFDAIFRTCGGFAYFDTRLARRATTAPAGWFRSVGLNRRLLYGGRLHGRFVDSLFAAGLRIRLSLRLRLILSLRLAVAAVLVAIAIIVAVVITIIAVAVALALFAVVATIVPIVVAPVIATLALAVALLGIGAAIFIVGIAVRTVEIVAVGFGIPGPLRLTLALDALRFFLTRAIVGEDTEIMVGELQIIFRVHPIAGQLRVARHVAVFFQQLGGVAARPTVDPVAIVVSAPVLSAGPAIIIVVPATIAATGLTIVNQW